MRAREGGLEGGLERGREGGREEKRSVIQFLLEFQVSNLLHSKVLSTNRSALGCSTVQLVDKADS